jgi:hypothetical protein
VRRESERVARQARLRGHLRRGEEGSPVGADREDGWRGKMELEQLAGSCSGGPADRRRCRSCSASHRHHHSRSASRGSSTRLRSPCSRKIEVLIELHQIEEPLVHLRLCLSYFALDLIPPAITHLASAGPAIRHLAPAGHRGRGPPSRRREARRKRVVRQARRPTRSSHLPARASPTTVTPALRRQVGSSTSVRRSAPNRVSAAGSSMPLPRLACRHNSPLPDRNLPPPQGPEPVSVSGRLHCGRRDVWRGRTAGRANGRRSCSASTSVGNETESKHKPVPRLPLDPVAAPNPRHRICRWSPRVLQAIGKKR